MLHSLVSSGNQGQLGSGGAPPSFSSAVTASGAAPASNVLLDVSGRVYSSAGVTCILPISARTADAGMSPQTLCTEMWHWDDVRREAAPNAAPFVSMHSLFKSTRMELHPFDGNNQIFEPMSVGIQSHLAGDPRQHFCSEMLFWDEYLAEKTPQGQPVPQPTMQQLFMLPVIERSLLELSSGAWKLTTYQFHCAAIKELEACSRQQTFCTEMLHYDDYLLEKKVTGQPSMRSKFGQQD